MPTTVTRSFRPISAMRTTTAANLQERKDRLSAKYGHLRAAADRRAEEAQRIAEANRRSKERPPELTAVALAGADGDAQVITVAVDEVFEGTKQ
jgi:hypothetical protein